MQQLSQNLWEIPQSYSSSMRVPARIYATEAMLRAILEEKALQQLINMSTLPGIEKYALAMPDIHQGYGFPIGGVAAFRLSDGVISPGGVGYDINCGVRLLASELSFNQIKAKITELINAIYYAVPSGVGSSSWLKLNAKELDKVLNEGVNWAVKNGYASEADKEFCEENGCFKASDAKLISAKAKERGCDQLGTLGSGNHFLEVQQVVEIFDVNAAKAFGIFPGQVTILIHTGSRGLGHQVCTDYVRLMNQKTHDFAITLPDRELACMSFHTELGQNYFQAMAAAANFAWTNRQLITAKIREVWERIFPQGSELNLVYDVAHNIAKQEQHFGQELIVHRKGATRAFGPEHPAIPKKYQSIGQPVFIPGSMGSCSYVLAGTATAMQQTFGSSCHGAGRRMSRSQSVKKFSYNELQQNLHELGVTVRCGSMRGLLEEAPASYKDIDSVVEVVCAENIAKKVAKLKPVAVVKG